MPLLPVQGQVAGHFQRFDLIPGGTDPFSLFAETENPGLFSGSSRQPAGRLPGAAGKKTWILGFGKQGKWICSTGDEVEALKVTGDLTLNRE